MIGYKFGACDYNGNVANCLITLEIPDDAIIINPFSSNKLRCDKALVKRIQKVTLTAESVTDDMDITFEVKYNDISEAINMFKYNDQVKYVVGSMVYPDYLETDMKKDCANGINFFSTEEEAFEFYIITALYNSSNVP